MKGFKAIWGASALTTGLSLLASPAMAQASDDAPSATEIIVTAQKRSQSIEDVPLTVSVLDGEALRDAGVQRVNDILPKIPAVGGFTTGVATSVWSIRGLSSNTTDGGGEPSVGVYRDESYAGYLEFAALPVYDVSRIEVLKGPQGTLYGKNSSAGAISIYTNKPDTSETGGSLAASLGNFGQRRGDGVLNLALSDTFAIRVAGQYNRLGDYQENMVTGGKNGGFEAWGLRVGALWQPGEGIEISGYYEHYDAKSDQWATNTAGLTGDTNTNHVYSVLADGVDDLKVDVGHLEIGIDLSDNLSLKAISNYGSSQYAWETDAFGVSSATIRAVTTAAFRLPMTNVLAFQMGGPGGELPRSRLYQQEVRLSWKSDNLFVSTGLHYTDYLTQFPYTGAQLGADPSGFRKVDTSGFKGPRTSLGLFIDGTWDVSDAFSLTAGVRYSRDKRKWTSFSTSDIYPIPAGTTVPFSYLTGTSTLTPVLGAGCPNNIIAPCLPAAGISASANDSGWTPRIAFKWEPAENVNVYGGYSRGFKAGGFNTATTGTAVIPYNAENVDSYELGIKGASSTFRYGLAGFWSEFRNLQLQTIVNALIRTSNAASARSRGFEAEVEWLANDQFKVFGNFTYLNAEYTSGQISAGATVAAKGLKMIRAPEVSVNFGATYTLDLGNTGKIDISPTIHAQSSMELSPINRATWQQPGYTTVDLRMKYTAPNDGWSLAVIGENLTNARLIRRVWDPLNLGASTNYNPDGAMVRAEVEVSF